MCVADIQTSKQQPAPLLKQAQGFEASIVTPPISMLTIGCDGGGENSPFGSKPSRIGANKVAPGPIVHTLVCVSTSLPTFSQQ
jgi:hypothetical protein